MPYITQAGVTRNLPSNGWSPTDGYAQGGPSPGQANLNQTQGQPWQGNPTYSTGYGGIDPFGMTDAAYANSGAGYPWQQQGQPSGTGGSFMKPQSMPSFMGQHGSFGPTNSYRPQTRSFGPQQQARALGGR